MNIETIGIIGSGKLGRVLENILPQIFPDASLVVSSRSNGIPPERASQCDLVIPAVPITAFEEVVEQISESISANSIFMDVCAVKKYPVEMMQKILPKNISRIASHPLFGPGTLEKTKGRLAGLRWMMHPVHIDTQRFTSLKTLIEGQGIHVIEMTAEEHDQYAAEFHFTAHVTAAILKELGLKRTPINTRSADSLFEFMEMVHTDSPSLLQEMMRYNPYCSTQLQKMKQAQEQIITYLST